VLIHFIILNGLSSNKKGCYPLQNIGQCKHPLCHKYKTPYAGGLIQMYIIVMSNTTVVDLSTIDMIAVMDITLGGDTELLAYAFSFMFLILHPLFVKVFIFRFK
jgi:hypothetical protein